MESSSHFTNLIGLLYNNDDANILGKIKVVYSRLSIGYLWF
jgi:hypothetical protein